MAMENPPSLEALFSHLQLKQLKNLIHCKGGFIIYVEGGMMILRAGESHDFLSTFFWGEWGALENFPKSKTRFKGDHQKVLVCSSFIKSVHNSCLYCFVYFLVTQTKESKIAFSINNKVAVIIALSPGTSFLFHVALVTGFAKANVMKCQKLRLLSAILEEEEVMVLISRLLGNPMRGARIKFT